MSIACQFTCRSKRLANLAWLAHVQLICSQCFVAGDVALKGGVFIALYGSTVHSYRVVQHVGTFIVDSFKHLVTSLRLYLQI